MPVRKHIHALIRPPQGELSAGIDYFRERLLFYLLLAIAGFGAIAYLPSIYYGVIYKFYSVVFIDTLALGWIFFLLTKKSLSFKTKCMGLLGAFYVLAVWLLISLGPTGAGFMWLLLFSIMTGVMLGFRPAVISFGINAITIGLLSVLIINQVIAWDLIHADAMAIWTVKGVNFLCINAIVSVSTGFLITKISWMAKAEQQRRKALADEMAARLRAEADKKELTARLYQSQKMEAMGTLAGGVAHDFNNILSTIMGYTELTLTDTTLPETARENLGQVIRAAERAKGISHQILTFSRHAPAHKAPEDLGQILRECLDLFRISIPAGICLTADIPDRAFPVLADKNQVHQVIMNLLTNSLQALGQDREDARPEISVRLGLAGPEDLEGTALAGADAKMLSLAVTDTGAGIPAHLLDRIFEPYFTTKQYGKGTGMGLSISHGIVRDHSGEILVTSIPDQGSTFTVLLPCHASPPEASAALPESVRTGHEHVLMVDDETHVLHTQKKMLSARGYRVTACPSPYQALDLLAADANAFQILVTDRKMTEMNGVELCRKVRASWPELPVILCSGFPEKEDEALFDAILVKPATGKDLASIIRQVLDKSPA